MVFLLAWIRTPSCRGYRLTVAPHNLLSWSGLEVYFSKLPTFKLASVLSFPGNLSVLLEPVLKAVHIILDLFSLTYISLWNCLVINWFFSLYSCGKLEGIGSSCSGIPVIHLIPVLGSSGPSISVWLCLTRMGGLYRHW